MSEDSLCVGPSIMFQHIAIRM